VSWRQVVKAATLVRDVLKTLKLRSWVKTTGGRGLHVVVPLKRKRTVTECLDFTRADRIEATYIEHAKILRAVMQKKADQARLLLKTHIEQSKAEVRKITLHTLQAARGRAGA